MSTTTSNTTQPTPWTPAHHASVSKAKPVRLLALDTGAHGKTALLEFPEGWQRTIDLPTQADAWHPLFDDLTQAERNRLRAHVAHPVVRHADGTRTREGALPFITEVISGRGCVTGERYFDVPAEDYGAGNLTGYRCAGELLKALQRGHGQHICLSRILEEVTAANTDEPVRQPSRRGSAAAFIGVVEEALVFFAKHARHQEFLAHRVAEIEKYQAYCAERDAADKAAFVQRMRQAKAKKCKEARNA